MKKKKGTLSVLNTKTFTPEHRKMLEETIKHFVTTQQGHGRTNVQRFTELARERYDKKGVPFPEKSVFVTQSPTEFALTTPLYWWTANNGKQYVYCESDYEIRHEGPDQEHGVQRVQAGVREIRHEVEFDPWANIVHEVRD